ncbi:hypothetical protein K435DRAFT_798882 [Dendrothele bispora CBS 962.96]|uniref:Integrase core domain-containing protein n=1 Tax=Dendrothele bispora (strain CBS 962.96) TaxID=1314807 RepID=A0A4S8LYX8_DENBC|nr:hypothetical protein K435DRAFT_798882 [Dendrothele bispora CBS 962.96]
MSKVATPAPSANSFRDYALPSRIRGDRGRENQAVALLIYHNKARGKSWFIYLGLVNTRIERLWVEVGRQFAWVTIYHQISNQLQSYGVDGTVRQREKGQTGAGHSPEDPVDIVSNPHLDSDDENDFELDLERLKSVFGKFNAKAVKFSNVPCLNKFADHREICPTAEQRIQPTFKKSPQTTSFNPHSEYDSNLRAHASQTQLASPRLLPGTALLGKSAVMRNGKK